MSETKLSFLSRDVFLQCGWIYTPNDPQQISVRESLGKVSCEKTNIGETDQAEILKLLQETMVLAFNPDDIKNPFQIKKVTLQDSQGQYSGPIYSFDFTDAKITFFAEILDDIEEPYLKARLADLLWLHYKLNKYNDKPKQHEYAKQAIEAYTSHKINTQTWFNNVDKCWNRAIRLCLQIKDDETKNELTDRLFTAFNQDYPDHKFMHLSLAQLLDKLKLDADCRNSIAKKLLSIGKELTSADDLTNAHRYIALAAKKYEQNAEQQCWAYCLALDAEICTKKAYVLFSLDNMAAANDWYEEALKIYKQIPEQYRTEHAIEDKILKVEKKIAKTRTAADEQRLRSEPVKIKMSEIVKILSKISAKYVSGKESFETALVFFALLDGDDAYQGSTMGCLKECVQTLLPQNQGFTLPTKTITNDWQMMDQAFHIRSVLFTQSYRLREHPHQIKQDATVRMH